MIEDDGMDALTTLSVKDFVKLVGSRTAVPGGGSVAALVGALVGYLFLLLNSNIYVYQIYHFQPFSVLGWMSTFLLNAH